MALEFALVAPVLLLFILVAMNAGFVGFYQMFLDDSVRGAARSVQIDAQAATNGPAFATAVCNELGIVLSNCASSITYKAQAASHIAGFSSMHAVALPSSGQYDDTFFSPSSLVQNADVLIQVSAPLPFYLPFGSNMVTLTGTNYVVATTALQVEPF